MHVLIIPSAYPTEDAPLRGTFFKEQALALKEGNLKVGVIYSETRRVTGINANTLKKFHFQVNDSLENGVRTVRLQGWNILMMRNSLGINLWVKQTLKLFKLYIKKYGLPDLIHV
ncbi:MAG: glycosyltransferase family 4 protein, partial [Clostridiales bacterium]|nr:glycosyltransferase family 4 protein [Clostridiales bacterium]